MKNNNFVNEKIYDQDIINGLGLFLIGLTSLGYVLFDRDFAELHFRLSFLGGLPLFVGEMLWIVCFALMIVKFFRLRRIGAYWLWPWIVVYGLWLLLKVVVGFFYFGPLAFRHAAIFYYPLFAIFGFLFFDRKFFSGKILLFLLWIIILVFVYRRYDLHWTFTLSSLAIILILHISSPQIRLLMITFFSLAVPYYAFFSTSRMMIIANACSLTILAAGLWRSLSLKKIHKIFILIFFGAGIIVSAYYSLSAKAPRRVFTEPNSVIELYKSMDRDIQGRKKAYEKIPISVQLYRPELHNNMYLLFGDQNKMIASLEISNQVATSRIGDVKPRDQNHFGDQNKMSSSSEISNQVAISRIGDVKPQDQAFLNDAQSKDGDVRSVSVATIVFRLFIWRDMLQELWQKKPFWGFDLGYPLRSKSLEVLGWASDEWLTLGWVEPHNSYLHILYRSGLIGIFFVSIIFGFFIWLLSQAFQLRSLTAILFSAIVWNWIVAANFLIIFEMPYTAIPFWTLFGLALAYCDQIKGTSVKQEG